MSKTCCALTKRMQDARANEINDLLCVCGSLSERSLRRNVLFYERSRLGLTIFS